MRALHILATILLGFLSTAAEAAGFRYLDVPADAGGPALRAAAWYPCVQPPGDIVIGPFTVQGVRDCPLKGSNLPLVVISHGRGGTFLGHHDTAAALADAGFVVVALNHPGDTATDPARTDDLSVFVQRPADIRRLIDFSLTTWRAAVSIDPERIGLFGFSRGGYTGLVAIGGNPDWAAVTDYCQGKNVRFCDQVRRKEYPAGPLTHDPRIKAAVIADPLATVFSPQSFAAVRVPVQLWASERGGDGVLPAGVAGIDKSLPGPHEYRVVPNSAHFAFLTPCPPALASGLPQLCVDANGFDRAAFHQQFNADVVAFFRKHLNP